jgi:uncharacterized protein (TIGR00730 family)
MNSPADIVERSSSATPLRRIGIYCASNDGARPAYLEAARHVGTVLAVRGLAVVYGGGRSGLMGAVADAAMAAGGEVIGVMPHGLVQREVAHTGLTALHIVDSMHERKAMMAELSDAFMVLPGGIGTFEEFFETWSWAQLGVHRKPIGLLNVDGFWTPLQQLLDQIEDEGFLRGTPRQWLLSHDDPEQLLEAFSTFDAPVVRRWLRLGET